MAFIPFASQFPMAYPGFIFPPTINTSTGLIDATGEKVAWQGYPQQKDIGKSLVSVGFRFGAVTKAGGSALTVSHQDINLAAGPPQQPDEVIDGQVAIANANASFASNTWIDTAAFDVPRTITAGPFAIVVEYDGAGRLGADSVVVSNLNTINSNMKNTVGSPVLKTAGWASMDTFQDIILVFSDGSYGSFLDAYPVQTLNAPTFNSGSAADERALEFTVPFSVKVDGAWATVLVAASADFDVVLYDGTTPMDTVSIDSNAIVASGAARMLRIPFSAQQQLDTGHTYRLALKPTTANNLTLYDFQMRIAGHLQAWPGEEAYYLSTRVDAGAWTPVLTRRPLMGLYSSAVNIPTGISRARGMGGF